MKMKKRNRVCLVGVVGGRGEEGGEGWCEEEREEKKRKDGIKLQFLQKWYRVRHEKRLSSQIHELHIQLPLPLPISHTQTLFPCVYTPILLSPPPTNPQHNHHRMRKWPPLPSNKNRAYGMDWMCKLKKNEAGERYTSNLPFSSVLVEFFDFGYNSPPFPSSFTKSILWELESRGALLRLYPWSNRSIAHSASPQFCSLSAYPYQKLFTSGPITINGAENMSV